MLDYGPPVTAAQPRGVDRANANPANGPVLRVGGFAVPYPAARIEEHYLPDVDRVLDAVDRSMAC